MNKIQTAKKITALKKDIKVWDKWLEYSLSCNAPDSFKEACTRTHKRRVSEIQKQIDKLEK